MEKGMKLKVRKQLDGRQQSNIIKLKGSLISKGYTQIIHILDQDEEFHINSFDIESGTGIEVREFITAFIAREQLEDSISIFK
ncbi:MULTISPECIES: hypothetical protein [unclassified Flavobacterium]|uniref:hypothetical protein n=1 Tax=unclassified Flavobacterium TaxID=196869 RepID=UPI00105CBD5F|nr:MULTISPECIES: hypothetical protein [unclassified Flavobacterium]TDP00270.1 hypothetical protein EV145_106159 [Flavobacterium sp. 245]TDW52123.1 hypothetical protein EV144_101807 [Flavobacterium sp. 270]